MTVFSKFGDGRWNSFFMAYEVWWALVLGFAISAVVQAWVPRAAVERGLSGSGVGPMWRATAFGAASSSCSYAAIAIAKSLFQKGASAASALAFQFASTNLVLGSIEVNYKLFLNAAALVVFAALMYMTLRRGATDPVCGMRVDRAKAAQARHVGHTYYFCSEHCRATFLAEPPPVHGRQGRATGRSPGAPLDSSRLRPWTTASCSSVSTQASRLSIDLSHRARPALV